MEAKEIGKYVVYVDEPSENDTRVNFYIYDGIYENVELTILELTILPYNEPFVVCSVKWDGSWHFSLESGTTPLHFCEQSEVQEFEEMLAKCYDWAAELMPQNKLVQDLL